MTPDPNAVPCARCGCKGNMSCGHEPLNKIECCTLDQEGVCPCCRMSEGIPIYPWARWDVQEAVDHSCSCGGKGPEDGCCPACEVWHRLHGRKVKVADYGRGNTLAGEIVACLRANLLRGTLTTQDDAEFERLLDEWSEKARMDAFEQTLVPAKTLAAEVRRLRGTTAERKNMNKESLWRAQKTGYAKDLTSNVTHFVTL